MRTGRCTILAALLLLSCSDEGAYVPWTTEARMTRVPGGAAPLQNLSDQDVADALGWASVQVGMSRGIGAERLIRELSASLKARGIDAAPLEKINAAYVASAPPIPAYEAQPNGGSVGANRYALGMDHVQDYYDCPVLAPEDNSGTDCTKLVQGVVVQVRNSVQEQRPDLESAYAEDFARLSTAARDFIITWQLAAQEFGVRLAAVYAEQELRAAAACDDKTNADGVARSLGREQGVAIVESRKTWALVQVTSCTTNTDEIAEQVRITSKANIGTYMKDNPVCTEADLSAANQAYVHAEATRREGIEEGIDQRVEILRQELFQARQAIPCVPPGGGSSAGGGQVGGQCDVAGCAPGAPMDDNTDNCLPDGHWQEVNGSTMCCREFNTYHAWRDGLNAGCRGGGDNGNTYCIGSSLDTVGDRCQQGNPGIGSPIAVDLQGDGVTFSTEQVAFDLLGSGGSGQRITWIGPGEGLLAIDLDDDGRITSGAELFGNGARCASGQRCYDGVEALRAWDAPGRGGNADGLIDARDRVFTKLRIWVDADQNGVSDASELGTLAAHGIRSFDLAADYPAERRPEGAISARLRVVTDGGSRSAYDVWFKIDLASHDLEALLPR